MSGRRATMNLLALTLLALLAGNADGEKDAGSDYTDNHIDLVPTHRTGIEKALQSLMGVVTGNRAGGTADDQPGDSTGRRNIFGKFWDSVVPKPVEKVKNATARGFGEILNLFENHFHAIFPGTLWCGGGNIAKNENDVGLFKSTDSCCRSHDNCPDNIEAGKSKDNIVNNGGFTRSACFCDREFYDCLKKVNSVVSNNIGATYFNILRPQCFAYDYPIDSCAKYGKNRFVDKKCVDYNLDYTREKTLEWFDNPDY